MGYEKQTCPKCNGSGIWGRYTAEPETCPTCNGSGYKEVWVDSSSSSSSSSSYSDSSYSSYSSSSSSGTGGKGKFVDSANEVIRQYWEGENQYPVGLTDNEARKKSAEATGYVIRMLRNPEWPEYADKVVELNSDFLEDFEKWENEFNDLCFRVASSYALMMFDYKDKEDFISAFNCQYLTIRYYTFCGKYDVVKSSVRAMSGVYFSQGNWHKNKGNNKDADFNYQRCVDFETSEDQLKYYKDNGLDTDKFKPNIDSINANAEEEFNKEHYEIAAYLWQRAADMGDTEAAQKAANAKNKIPQAGSARSWQPSSSYSGTSTTTRYYSSSKNKVVLIILSVLLGFIGADRFYGGRIGLGILKFLTFGVWGIWWFIDIILAVTGKQKDGNGNYID